MKPCKLCGTPFPPSRAQQVHCSPKCCDTQRSRNQARRRRAERKRCTKCAWLPCRKVFWTRMRRRVFCNDRCRRAAGRRAQRECRLAEARIAAREVR